MIAFDLETTNISKGTPRPLYITAFSEAEGFSYARRVESIGHLRELLVTDFLIPRFSGAKFVAWNANGFDSYIVAAALIQESGYEIRPFLTRSKNLRGMMVMRSDENDLPEKSRAKWYFLDGIAMLGLVGTSLEKFLKVFAPDHRKLKEAIDFERETFDPSNPEHREYAMRDSEGLYYGMVRAEEILLQYFNQSLAVTMGGACIKILTAHIPEGVQLIQPSEDCTRVIRDYVMRGGFCYCVGKYKGPVWKYDINQAYAAAMREADLPAGNLCRVKAGGRYDALAWALKNAPCYVVKVSGYHPRNAIPFYYKAADHRGIARALFSDTELAETWITSIEHRQLVSEGWKLTASEAWYWSESFNLSEYVNKLEHVRTTCEGGPSGPIGTMIKCVGNHSYGKTVEQLDGMELVIAKDAPPGFAEFMPMEDDGLSFPHVWYRMPDEAERDRKTSRNYHQPQIGAFITAHVRMVVRRAALADPEAWLYADTDCVVFSRDVTKRLPIDSKRYGAFKVEAAGEPYQIIAKKVYASLDGATRHAKGLNVKRLTGSDFDAWYSGIVPEQVQIQRQNFVKTMAGSEMYLERSRKGTRV